MDENTNLIKSSQVRLYAKDFSVSKDFCSALDVVVKEVISKAMTRCVENNRRTLMIKDL